MGLICFAVCLVWYFWSFVACFVIILWLLVIVCFAVLPLGGGSALMVELLGLDVPFVVNVEFGVFMVVINSGLCFVWFFGFWIGVITVVFARCLVIVTLLYWFYCCFLLCCFCYCYVCCLCFFELLYWLLVFCGFCCLLVGFLWFYVGLFAPTLWLSRFVFSCGLFFVFSWLFVCWFRCLTYLIVL